MRRNRKNIQDIGSEFGSYISKEELKELSSLLDKFIGSLEEGRSCLTYNACVSNSAAMTEIADDEYLDVRAARVVVKRVLEHSM